MRDTGGDPDGFHVLPRHLNQRYTALRRTWPKVAHAERRSTHGDDQVIVVLNVHMNSPQHPCLRADEVPLNRVNTQVPLTAKKFSKASAEIFVHVQRTAEDTCWEVSFLGSRQ